MDLTSRGESKTHVEPHDDKKQFRKQREWEVDIALRGKLETRVELYNDSTENEWIELLFLFHSEKI